MRLNFRKLRTTTAQLTAINIVSSLPCF